MSNLCVCGEPAGDAFLGKRCAERLERALGDLPALIEDLDITLTRQSVIGAHGDGGKPAKKDAQPLSLNLAAADVAHDLRHTLVSAVRHLTESRQLQHGPDCKQRKWHPPLVWRTCGGCGQPKDNPTSMVVWLLRYHAAIPLDPAGPDIADAIHAVSKRIWDVVDLPTTRGRFKVGMCPELDTESIACSGEVWAYLPAEDLGVISTLRCRKCFTEYEPRHWMEVGLRILKRGAA